MLLDAFVSKILKDPFAQGHGLDSKKPLITLASSVPSIMQISMQSFKVMCHKATQALDYIHLDDKPNMKSNYTTPLRLTIRTLDSFASYASALIKTMANSSYSEILGVSLDTKLMATNDRIKNNKYSRSINSAKQTSSLKRPTICTKMDKYMEEVAEAQERTSQAIKCMANGTTSLAAKDACQGTQIDLLVSLIMRLLKSVDWLCIKQDVWPLKIWFIGTKR